MGFMAWPIKKILCGFPYLMRSISRASTLRYLTKKLLAVKSTPLTEAQNHLRPEDLKRTTLCTIQGNQLNMAVFFWYLGKRGFSSVRVQWRTLDISLYNVSEKLKCNKLISNWFDQNVNVMIKFKLYKTQINTVCLLKKINLKKTEIVYNIMKLTLFKNFVYYI